MANLDPDEVPFQPKASSADPALARRAVRLRALSLAPMGHGTEPSDAQGSGLHCRSLDNPIVLMFL